MLRLDASATRATLSFADVADAIAVVLRAKRAGTTHAPDRIHLSLPKGGVLLVMPACDETLAVTKLVTVHPANAALGMPVVQGEVIIADASTGRRLVALDGATVTAVRTAAVSLAAARLLAPEPTGDLLVIGSGEQAAAHLEAFAAGLGVRRVYVVSRNRANAERLAVRARTLGLDAFVRDDPKVVLPQVRLVVTATTSFAPVLPADVAPGTFVAAVGAYTADMAELPPELVRRAARPGSLLVVDTLRGARDEAGDLIQAGIDWTRVLELEQVLEGHPAVPDMVLFKSVGHALWDLAAARVAVRSLGLLNPA